MRLCLSSRRGASKLQDEVCFLCLPPGFPAVPQYFIHTKVALQPLSEPYKRLSHIRLLGRSFSEPPFYDMGSAHLKAHLSVPDLCSRLRHSLYSGRVSSSTVDQPWGPSLRGHYPTSSLTIAAYRSPSLATWPFEPLFLHWCSYSGTCLARFPKSPCSSLAWLLACRCAARCCLRPRGGSWHLSLTRRLHGLRPD